MNLPPELSTLCVIVGVVAILIILAGLLVYQVVRGSIFGLGMMVMRTLTTPREEPTNVNIQALPRNTADVIRAKVEEVDFDAAVAKYRQEQGIEAEPQALEPNPPPPETPIVTPPPLDTRSPIKNRGLRNHGFRGDGDGQIRPN